VPLACFVEEGLYAYGNYRLQKFGSLSNFVLLYPLTEHNGVLLSISKTSLSGCNEKSELIP
jgi:hypothetical protein